MTNLFAFGIKASQTCWADEHWHARRSWLTQLHRMSVLYISMAPFSQKHLNPEMFLLTRPWAVCKILQTLKMVWFTKQSPSKDHAAYFGIMIMYLPVIQIYILFTSAGFTVGTLLPRHKPNWTWARGYILAGTPTAINWIKVQREQQWNN